MVFDAFQFYFGLFAATICNAQGPTQTFMVLELQKKITTLRKKVDVNDVKKPSIQLAVNMSQYL